MMKILMINDHIMITLGKSEAEVVTKALALTALPHDEDDAKLIGEIIRQLRICIGAQ